MATDGLFYTNNPTTTALSVAALIQAEAELRRAETAVAEVIRQRVRDRLTAMALEPYRVPLEPLPRYLPLR